MSIGMIDAIALGVLIFSILFALYRGLVTELLGISSWILACFGAIYSYTPMQAFMHKFIENEKLAGLCGSALVALIILVLMTIINAHINRKLRQSSLSGLDRLLGMIFGVARAVLLMALLYMGAAVALSEPALRDMEKENVSMVYIRKTVELLKKFVPQNVQNDLGMNEEQAQSDQKPKKIGTDLKRSHKLPEKSHQKAMKRFVEEIKPDKAKSNKTQQEKVSKPISKPTTSSVNKPEADKNKAIEKSKEKTKAVQKNKEATVQKVSPAKTPTVTPKAVVTPQYNSKERESLDNMVEQLMEKGG